MSVPLVNAVGKYDTSRQTGGAYFAAQGPAKRHGLY
jgi:hypothetical protein